MALKDVNRGWQYSSDGSFARGASEIAFASVAVLDTHMRDIIRFFASLVEIKFDTCSFPGEASFEDIPVVENAASLKVIHMKSSTSLEPGSSSDGVPVAWGAATLVEDIDVSGNSWTAEQVDDFCIALDAAVQAGLGGAAAACTLDISGNTAPTATSATARANLAGYSPAWTLTTD